MARHWKAVAWLAEEIDAGMGWGAAGRSWWRLQGGRGGRVGFVIGAPLCGGVGMLCDGPVLVTVFLSDWVSILLMSVISANVPLLVSLTYASQGYVRCGWEGRAPYAA